MLYREDIEEGEDFQQERIGLQFDEKECNLMVSLFTLQIMQDKSKCCISGKGNGGVKVKQTFP